MPDPVTHYVFGQMLLQQLPEKIAQKIDQSVFDQALQGPDPWSTCGFFGGKRKKFAVRSRIMHKEKTGEFLSALACSAKADGSTAAFSLLAGMLCHYCLDTSAHPYIICKGGNYDGRADTKIFNSGHVRLERAIDSYYLRKTFQRAPWHVCFARRFMKMKRYPASLAPVINDVFFNVYGWENAFDDFNAALQDDKWFYLLMQDPLGLVHYLLRPVSGGKTNYCIYSYYKREVTEQRIDYLNLRHEIWHHPFDPSMASCESFFDLFAQALEHVQEMICRIDAWMDGADVCIETLIGNADYSTGFACDDPRNLNQPTCEPLRFGSKYWNNL